MKLKRFTAEQIHAFHPCGWDGGGYSLQKIYKLMGKRKTVTVLDVARVDGVPDTDKIWLILRMLDHDDRTAYIEQIVRRVVRKYAVHCGVADIERWAAAWLRGTTWARTADAAYAAGDIAYAAADAAYAAADAADAAADAADAAYAAARAAAHAADAANGATARAAAAAANAAYDAAYDAAARAAAYAVARAAERTKQIQVLIQMATAKRK